MINWNAIQAIGDMAGAVGVIVTLIYLSIQLRQNTKASRVTAIQNSMENSARFSELLATHDDLSHIFWLGLSDPDSLDADSKRKFVSTLNVFMRRELVAFYLHRQGVMPDHLWAARLGALTSTFNQPGLKMYLSVARDTLPEDFQSFLDEIAQRKSTMSDDLKSLLTQQEA